MEREGGADEAEVGAGAGAGVGRERRESWGQLQSTRFPSSACFRVLNIMIIGPPDINKRKKKKKTNKCENCKQQIKTENFKCDYP